jgi:hypothetical protein
VNNTNVSSSKKTPGEISTVQIMVISIVIVHSKLLLVMMLGLVKMPMTSLLTSLLNLMIMLMLISILKMILNLNIYLSSLNLVIITMMDLSNNVKLINVSKIPKTTGDLSTVQIMVLSIVIVHSSNQHVKERDGDVMKFMD